MLADRFGGGVTKNTLGAWIPSADQPIEADAQDRIGRRFHDSGQPSARLICALALEELPELASNSSQHLNKILVRHADLPAEAFDNPKHLIAESYWETNRRVKPCLGGRRGSREIWILSDLGEPNRLAAGPNTARQTNALGKPELPGNFFELRHLQRWYPPDFQTIKFIDSPIHIPDHAQFPSALFAKTPKNHRGGFLQRGCICQRPADRILDLQPLLGSLAVGDDQGQH